MSKKFAKIVIVIFLFIGVIYTQLFYDAQRTNAPLVQTPLPPAFFKAFDLGLNSALASFLWINTRTEMPFFREGYEKFRNDFNLVTSLDPKFSTPYAYTLIVLPNTNYPDKFNTAVEIGLRGVRNADPNWKIPLYLAITYHLYLHDNMNAAKYFDLAARTPGIPEIVWRFAVNYGILPSLRAQTEQIWKVIYETADDKFMKERAKAYVTHYEILDFLESAVASYKKKFGVYPQTIDDLIAKGIIKSVPPDPFGLNFAIYEKGVVGIKQLQN
jgi:hypothetical protein